MAGMATTQLQIAKVPSGTVGSEMVVVACPETPASTVSMGAVQRAQLTTYAGVTPLAKAVEDSLHPADVLEGMLCDQLSAVHNAGMRLLAKASVADGVDSMVRLTAAATRLVESFQGGVLVLNRIRNSREQPTLVQNVSVRDGGRAVVTANLRQDDADVTK